MQFSSHCVTSIFTYPSISTTHIVKLNLICPHSMHCDQLLVWDKYFCIFLQGFNFKICCSLSKCQMLDNSIHPMLPLLPMVTPLAGLLLWRGTSSAAHPAILGGPAEPSWVCQRTEVLDPAWRGQKAVFPPGNPTSLPLSMQVWLFWPLGSVLVRLNVNIYYAWKLFAEGVGEAKSTHY